MTTAQAIEIVSHPDEYRHEQAEAYQALIDSGIIQHIDDKYQRHAQELINQGICQPSGNFNKDHGMRPHFLGEPAGGFNSFANKKTEIAEGILSWARGTKIVDEDGMPKLVYHGTNVRGMSKFNVQRAQVDLEHGGFFISDPQAANHYGPVVHPVVLRIVNPVRMTWEDWWRNTEDDFVTNLKLSGYDGIIIEPLGSSKDPLFNSTTYVAFDNEQIELLPPLPIEETESFWNNWEKNPIYYDDDDEEEMPNSQINKLAKKFADINKISIEQVEVAELSDKIILSAGAKMSVIKTASDVPQWRIEQSRLTEERDAIIDRLEQQIQDTYKKFAPALIENYTKHTGIDVGSVVSHIGINDKFQVTEITADNLVSVKVVKLSKSGKPIGKPSGISPYDIALVSE